jgi:uncharacterized protein
VVVVSDGEGRDALVAAARRGYAPSRMLAGPWASADVLAGKAAQGGVARAFVCRGQACSAPVSDPVALTALVTAEPG